MALGRAVDTYESWHNGYHFKIMCYRPERELYFINEKPVSGIEFYQKMMDVQSDDFKSRRKA